jgi:hypothetical protein
MKNMAQRQDSVRESFPLAAVAAVTFVRSAAVALAINFAYPHAALATEGGTGHYMPGGVATLIDLAPTKPGWVVEPIYLHYQGSASAAKSIPLAGVITAGLEAKSDAALLGGLYTFGQTVLGAHYTVGAYLPYVWISAEANVGTVRRRDTASDIGDMTLIPAMLAWKTGFWQFNALLPVSAPTGGYHVGQLANTGLNYWTFDPTIGASYNNEKIGFNTALHLGVTANTKNYDTDYTSGSTLHLDGSVQQLLPAGPGYIGAGAEAFYLQQVSADSGSGTSFGDFKGHTVGIGPVVSYILPLGKETFVTEFRWLPELDVKRRLDGNYFWLKAVYQF